MVEGEQGWREGRCTQGPFIDQVDGPSGRNPRMGHSVDRGTRRLAWGNGRNEFNLRHPDLDFGYFQVESKCQKTNGYGASKTNSYTQSEFG